eukprot:PLAT13346.1.p1 GENE.PLAT13346.1~~PLAT13346.1.p1  ORF type:complete len:122 (+),score=36.24 PLAT13346.1:23-367(+)
MAEEEAVLPRFLEALRSTPPVIPDAVVKDLLRRRGFTCDDVLATRLAGLAAEKLLVDIFEVERKHTKVLVQSSRLKGRLSMDSFPLIMADFGVKLDQPAYFVDDRSGEESKSDK